MKFLKKYGDEAAGFAKGVGQDVSSKAGKASEYVKHGSKYYGGQAKKSLQSLDDMITPSMVPGGGKEFGLVPKGDIDDRKLKALAAALGIGAVGAGGAAYASSGSGKRKRAYED